MKILIVSYYPNPALGGVWRIVSQLKVMLEDLGHEVDILSQDPNVTKYRIFGRKLEVSKSELSPMIEKVLKSYPVLQSNSWLFNAEINRYCLELSALYYTIDHYDLIHTQDVIAARSINRIKPKHIPLITSIHGYLSGAIFYHLKTMHRQKTEEQIKKLVEYKYHRALEHIGIHSSDFIHTDSKWMRNLLIDQYGVSPQKIFTFPYGMDVDQFTSQTGEVTVTKNKKVILFTGRLVYLKGVELLIDALAKLRQERSDWECWILGEGPLQKELQEKCKGLYLTDDVKFLGVAHNVVDYLKQADLFIHPSLQDNQPYSVMEAELLGVPVIVSDASGLPEMVIDGKTGFIIPSGNSEQIYNKIKYLLENEEKRKEMAKHAKEWAIEQWQVNKMRNKYLDMYNQVLEKNK